MIFRKPSELYKTLSNPQIKLLAVSGFLGIFLPQFSFCLGLSFSSAGFTSPWMLLTPIFTILLGILLKHEQNDRLKSLGLVISGAGTLSLLSFEINSSPSVLSSLTASIFLTISSLSSASAVLIWKRLVIREEVPILICAFWSLLSGSVIMLISYALKPLWCFWSASHSLASSLSGLPTIISCFFIVFSGYSITYSILFWAIQKSSLSTVALYPSARPIFTVLLSLIIHPNSFIEPLWVLFSICLVLTGLLLAAFSKEMERKSTKDQRREAKKASLKNELNITQPPNSQSNYYKLN